MTLRLTPVDGVGEVLEGTDLAALLDHTDLADGDVLVVTSKIVAKAEGMVRTGDREDSLAEETVRVVARRGPVRIVENRQGLVMAAAGIDASNTETGTHVLLPVDPDASARGLREELHSRRGVNVGVVVADTAGRAWRLGQTDIAIGAAGLAPMVDFAGLVDGYGNELAVTAPAQADEIASAAELASGKLGGRPLVLLRGLDVVLPAGEHGPGAKALQRPREQDMFSLGTREAVVAALRGEQVFGAPAAADELLEACALVGISAELEGEIDSDASIVVPAEEAVRATTLAFAFGWRAAPDAPRSAVRLRPTP